MASYRLIWKRSAEEELRKIPRDAVILLLELAESLIENPYPTTSIDTGRINRLYTLDFLLLQTYFDAFKRNWRFSQGRRH